MAAATAFDWPMLLTTDLQKVEDNPTFWHEELTSLKVEEEDDLPRLRKAFQACQVLMNVKHEEGELFKEELDELNNKMGSTRNQEELLGEIESLKEEIKQVKRYGGESVGVGDNTRILRQEINELEREVGVLKKDLENAERDVNNEKRYAERHKAKCEDLEKEAKDLRRETEQQRDDIQDLQRQVESQRESQLMKKGKEVESRDVLRTKNQELLKMNEEFMQLVENNTALRSEVEELNDKLKVSVQEMEKTTDGYLKLKGVLKQTDTVLDNLKRENEMLRIQVSDLTNSVQTKTDADDEIMVAVNRKVEEWRYILERKDKEIVEYREQVKDLRQELVGLTMDTDKASLAALNKALEERDKQIAMLRENLDQATADLNANNALIEDMKGQYDKDLTGEGGDRHIRKIKDLQGTLKFNEEILTAAESGRKAAETDARSKDKELSDALERMRQYESGEYGLSEAVKEIKDCKLQIQVRDRQIEGLTQEINQVNLALGDLEDEREELRERLGLDPSVKVDLTDYRKRKSVRTAEEKALNQILQKENEKLEEERMELKKQIRRLAMNHGQKAVALGLNSDDMVAVDEFIEDRKKKNTPGDQVKRTTEADELKIRAAHLKNESDKYLKDMERVRQTNAELNLKNKDLVEENKKLEQGLKEILQSLKEGKEKGEDGVKHVTVECPSLDRMLAAIEAKQMTGRYDAALHLKAQVDNLTGRNEELRREIRESRVEGTKAQIELDSAKSKLGKLTEDLKLLHEGGGKGMLFKTMALPEGMAVSSADVIASLNEHLIQVIHELSVKEEMLEKMEKALDNYKRKFAVVRHQQGLLYEDYNKDKGSWESEREKVAKRAAELEGSLSEERVRRTEFEKLLDTLGMDEDESKRRLSDLSRKITVLTVNEKALTRRHTMMDEVEAALRKANTKLQNEMVAMETAVTERLGYLQRYKDMASFKIASLQRALEDSVPAGDLQLANKQYQELTEKYRDLLERGNNLIAKNELSATLELEVRRLESEKSDIQKELEIEKEKVHTYEESLESLRQQGVGGGLGGATTYEGSSMAKKLTMVEMRELNERQRAEHAVRLYQQQRETMHDLEQRNSELEVKFAQVTKMNLEAQRTERELRDELANCVLKTVSDADREKITVLEASTNSLKLEKSRLKEMADIAMTQARAIESQKLSQEKELRSLRQQLVDIQAQSDEKKVIGKLHRHIVQLQVSEGTAVKKLEEALKQIGKLQSRGLRLEQVLDEKEQTIQHNRAENANKSRHLRRTIHELRQQYSGSVPLSRQEKFSRAMVKLQEDKEKIEKDLAAVMEQRNQVEDKLAQLEVQHTGLQELMSTLKDAKGATKVVEWHTKMEGLRLDDLKKSRQIHRSQEQIKYMEGLVRQHEVTVSNLEEESVKFTRHYEERQLLWEQREVELERIISKMEKQQQQIAGVASKFEEATGALPDITLPLSEQLEQAIATIKNNVRVILETQVENRNVKRTNEDLTVKVKELEERCFSRDRVIAELRMRLPATAHRDTLIEKATEGALYKEDDYETRQALRVAQSTLQSLQARIAQKEETIAKYQELLKQSRNQVTSLATQHEDEMITLQGALDRKQDDAFSNFRRATTEIASKGPGSHISNQQLAKLNELEDTVAQQDEALATMSERVKRAHADADAWKRKAEQLTRELTKDKEQLIEEHHSLVQRLDKEIDEYRSREANGDSEIDRLRDELKQQTELVERAPTTVMRKTVDRLRRQLEEKETQQQALSKALVEMRSDLVAQAEVQVKATAADAEQEVNIKRLLDKKTRDLQERIRELETHVDRNKADGRKKKDRESHLQVDVSELREELSQKEGAMIKLKEGKRRLETENEELERKIDRMMSAKRSAGAGLTTGEAGEVETLRRRVRSLEEELKKKNKAERPYESTVPTKAVVTKTEAVAKWEETKRLQKIVDKLKLKVKDREDEVSKMAHTNEMMKNALDRVTREKEVLEKKASAAHVGLTVPRTSPLFTKTTSPAEMHAMQDLKEKNFKLEEDLSRLRDERARSGAGVGGEEALEEVKRRNRQLSEQLIEMEKRLAARMQDGGQGGASGGEAGVLEGEMGRLRREVVTLTEDNLSLRFRADQADRDVPRLKERLADLQQYVEVLRGSSGGSTASSGIRKLGESGKSTKELEKTILLLKKVVERTQAENQELKKAPGIVRAEQITLLGKENEGLKGQLEDLKLKMGATLSERYQSKSKGTAKIMTDYERLRKDLKKESDSHEKMRSELHKEKLTNEQLRREAQEAKSALEIEQVRRQTASEDSKSWNSAVTTRMYEEKLRKLERENDAKTKLLSDVKQLLRDAAIREKLLIKEKEDLQSQVALLERYPTGSADVINGAGGAINSDVTKDHQLARRRVSELEGEVRQLQNQVHTLLTAQASAAAGGTKVSDTLLRKSTSHDKMSADNLELSMQMKFLKLENDRKTKENDKLSKELKSLGPEFFEEIEDLKYQHKQSGERCGLLREKLRQLSDQFGVHVDIPWER